MDTSTIIWIVVAVIVVAAVVAVVMSRSGARRAESERAKAAQLREQATQHDRELRERETTAAETRAKAEMARVEAQKRELEAERLAAEADNRSQSAADLRSERDDQLRRADLRDPDVRTDKEGYRVDEHGNRIGDAQPGGRGDLGSDWDHDGDRDRARRLLHGDEVDERADETVRDASRDEDADDRSAAGQDRGGAEPRERGV